MVMSTSGSQQVGYADLNGAGHAFLWTGSAQSAVDLSPAGAEISEAWGAGGGQQVGWGKVTATGALDSFLWTGTAASAIDLTPAGHSNSTAYGTDGVHQVGSAGGDAFVWSGTAASGVDLHPTWLGYGNSIAYGAGGNQQVGRASGGGTGGATHAVLWTGTAASAVDLNSAAFNSSEAFATNGVIQVGYGNVIADNHAPHALMWQGTAASVFDLQALLPSNVSWTRSYAETIDPAGDIFGYAYGTQNGNNVTYAVEWANTPEPASLSIFAIAGAGLLIRRRRR